MPVVGQQGHTKVPVVGQRGRAAAPSEFVQEMGVGVAGVMLLRMVRLSLCAVKQV